MADGREVAMRIARGRMWCLTPRRVGLVLCVLGFIWAMMLMNLSLVGRSDDIGNPEELRVGDHVFSSFVLFYILLIVT